MSELNGDDRLSATDRLRYLWRNAVRGLAGFRRCGFAFFERWPADMTARAMLRSASPSPGRALAESFVIAELPRLVGKTEIDVLEIGCGSGRARELLARAGFTGHYTGIDVQDRFDRTNNHGFQSKFVCMDAHTIAPGARFDLVYSNSALEHIPGDTALVERLRTTLHPDGVQFHIVPSGAALYAYLWHGYRQYARHMLAERFSPARTEIHTLGGAFTLLAHISLVTVPELLLRLPIRQRVPRVYRPVMRAALSADALIPFGAVMYAVCERTGEPDK